LIEDCVGLGYLSYRASELSRLQQQLSTVQQQLSSAQEREHAVVQQYSTLQHEVQQMQEARRHDEHQVLVIVLMGLFVS
jgi:uncharacterized coiled-coil DUF342 family protein